MAGVTFTKARIIDTTWFHMASSPDSDEPYTPFTRWFEYIKEEGGWEWQHHDVPWWGIATALYDVDDDPANGAVVNMSREGHVQLMFSDYMTEEKIAGAGVFTEDARGWGYMSDLKQFGACLYACGDGGQVYKRIAEGQWEHMDKGLLQEPGAEGITLLYGLGGALEDDIYVVGSVCESGDDQGVIFHYDGTGWNKIITLETSCLTRVYTESADRLWVCGQDGVLLMGNVRDGFQNVCEGGGGQHFLDLTLFKKAVYLVSTAGLYKYELDAPDQGIIPVATGLKPALSGLHSIDSYKNILLVVGEKDVATFNGKKWQRIHHPCNSEKSQ